MMHPGYQIEVTGQSAAMNFAVNLVAASKWFVMTPLPDDQWEFLVKDEPEIQEPEYAETEWEKIWLDGNQNTWRRYADKP